MHSFTHHHHHEADKASSQEAKAQIGNEGWRYDLMEWFIDTFQFRGQVRELRNTTLLNSKSKTHSRMRQR